MYNDRAKDFLRSCEIKEKLFEEIFTDLSSEKWSKKYKRSIDCSRPKGFSQRAHCQGRKKK